MLLDDDALNKLTGLILAAAIEVHRSSDPGCWNPFMSNASSLRITGKTAGLLINFNVPRLMDGVKRLVNPAYAA
jgi:hypothetical protein